MSKDKINFKAIRVYLTEKCNANCPTCFNANNRANAEMTPDKFELICRYFNQQGIKGIKIMGGEPTVHGNFSKMIKIAQKYFSRIFIFSNGLRKDAFNELEMRENDVITYNFNFANSYSDEIFLLNQKFVRYFEIQVNATKNEIKIINQIDELYNKYGNIFTVALTLDCTSDIFTEKEVVVKKLQYIEKYLIEKKCSFVYDHKMPYCYLYGTGLHAGFDALCAPYDSCLIDAEYNLRMCNQHPEKIINIFSGGKIIPWAILENYLFEKFYELQLVALKKICRECVFYNSVCNGGCFITSPKVTKELVFSKTDFPMMRSNLKEQ